MTNKSVLPNEPAAEWSSRIRGMQAAGMTAVDIAEASRLPVRTIYNIVGGRVRFVYGATAQALATVTEPVVSVPAGFCDATGSRRRTQALARLGHPHSEVHRLVGMGNATHGRLVRGKCRYIATEHARAISDVYEDLSCVAGDSKRTRSFAAKSGWLPPEVWHDVDIDDPGAEPNLTPTSASDPDWVVVDRVLRQEVSFNAVNSKADRDAVIVRLTREGLRPGTIAKRVGTSQRVVVRALKRIAA